MSIKNVLFVFLLALILVFPTSYASTSQTTQGGKVIGYLPGWVDASKLPTGQALSQAGYTHIIVAFGLFSLDQPGQVLSDFPTVTKSYVASLQAAGIKVLFSLGGADSGLPNGTVDFDQVLQMAKSPTQFQTDLVASIQQTISQYGFDGVDFDIEDGFTGQGTIDKPTGDVAVLANVINTLHQNNSKLLISLVPQVDNIAATSGFGNPWASYSSLIMQTSPAISWVGIQLYNTGCADGIDDVCYANNGLSQDFSVAMATDLLENWPAKDPYGRDTGFQHYINYLRPDQVVLGYPSTNSQGGSNALPVTANGLIMQAIQCLRTGKSCGQYTPPDLYPTIGGVFNWEVTYDADNHFQFANQLKNCVLKGNCT